MRRDKPLDAKPNKAGRHFAIGVLNLQTDLNRAYFGQPFAGRFFWKDFWEYVLYACDSAIYHPFRWDDGAMKTKIHKYPSLLKITIHPFVFYATIILSLAIIASLVIKLKADEALLETVTIVHNHPGLLYTMP